jgi:hypothetical protein
MYRWAASRAFHNNYLSSNMADALTSELALESVIARRRHSDSSVRFAFASLSFRYPTSVSVSNSVCFCASPRLLAETLQLLADILYRFAKASSC